jgi:hypothetical protein
MRFQTLRNAAVRTHSGSIDPALILLAGVGAGFDFHFNNYLHPLPYAQLRIPTQPPADHKLRISFTFRPETFSPLP